jgi:hypothetical protein
MESKDLQGCPFCLSRTRISARLVKELEMFLLGSFSSSGLLTKLTTFEFANFQLPGCLETSHVVNAAGSWNLSLQSITNTEDGFRSLFLDFRMDSSLVVRGGFFNLSSEDSGPASARGFSACEFSFWRIKS